jgi:predicted transglutaminase-like cysteine proteinase
MQFSDKLIEKLKNEGSWGTVKNYIFEKTFIGKLIYYVTDWRYRSQSKNLNLWIKDNSTLPDEVKELVEPFRNLNEFDKVKKSLEFVNKNITYRSDKEVWKVEEHWANPIETWQLKQDDCEGGAVFLYSILNYLGVPDDSLFIVAGDVMGGGHCYLVWVSSKDMQEYALDWCYWYSTSIKLNTPYHIIASYYYGMKEWFRFNKTGSWVHRYYG